MRIIIEIEGEDVTIRTAEEPGAMYVSQTPPPELLRAAAARGATNAGPAPRGEMAEPAVDLSAAPVESLAEPVDAGAAPFPPAGKSSGEGEKRTGDIDEQRR